MANPEYSEDMNGRKQGGVMSGKKKSGAAAAFPEKDAGFPGVPGKTQPKGFFKGGYKCHVYPKSEGL